MLSLDLRINYVDTVDLRIIGDVFIVDMRMIGDGSALIRETLVMCHC